MCLIRAEIAALVDDGAAQRLVELSHGKEKLDEDRAAEAAPEWLICACVGDTGIRSPSRAHSAIGVFDGPES